MMSEGIRRSDHHLWRRRISADADFAFLQRIFFFYCISHFLHTVVLVRIVAAETNALHRGMLCTRVLGPTFKFHTARKIGSDGKFSLDAKYLAFTRNGLQNFIIFFSW